MPRFAKTCNNPLHNEWSKGSEDSKVVKLKAFGWCELAEALANFLACEKQIKRSKKNQPTLQKLYLPMPQYEKNHSAFAKTTAYGQ